MMGSPESKVRGGHFRISFEYWFLILVLISGLVLIWTDWARFPFVLFGAAVGSHNGFLLVRIYVQIDKASKIALLIRSASGFYFAAVILYQPQLRYPSSILAYSLFVFMIVADSVYSNRTRTKHQISPGPFTRILKPPRDDGEDPVKIVAK